MSGFIETLCFALAHRWEPERLFVPLVLTAYLDESGTHDGSLVTVMGGVLATARQWKAFEENFSLIKKKHEFNIFHTKKFKKRDGDFSGWTNEECLELVADMAEVTRGAFTESAAMTLDNATYDSDYKGGENPRRLRLDTKYGLCFRQCLYFFIKEGFKRTRRKKFPKLHFVLESGHKNKGDALRIFNEVSSDLRKDGCDLLAGITFMDKDECDPLMIADFIAHTTFTRETRFKVVGERTPFPEDEKGKSGITHLRYFPEGLADLKKDLLEHHFSKNLSRARSGREQLS